MAKVLKHVEPCYYCGMPATSIDHVVPRKLLNLLHSLDDELTTQTLMNRNRTLLVRSCRECNSLLSSRYDESLLSRKRRLRKILHKRYKNVLLTPSWTDTDLNIMGYTVKTYIEQQIKLKTLIQKRLAWNRRKEPVGGVEKII